MTDAPSPSLSDRFRSAFNDTFSLRSRKQLTLFAAGSAFLFLSTTVTRRAIAQRRLATTPRFYNPSNLHPPGASQVYGPMEALQALNIATLNVAAASMMMVGGTLWAFDISSIEEMRRKIRGGLGVDGTGRSEGDLEEEFEEWVASVLSRKDAKERKKLEGKEPAAKEWVNERGKER